MIRLSPESAARRLVKALVSRGCNTFFGIPGGPICPVFEAIRVTEGARLVESRHETAAAFEAAAFYRVSGRVAVVVVTAGPGATNVVTGIASAHLERIPILLIVGDVAWATSGGRLAQDSGLEGLNVETMFSTITRVRVRASASRSVVPQAMAALDAAVDPAARGPALFVLALDHAVGECLHAEVTARAYPRGSGSPPPAGDVDRALDHVRDATHPLVVIGGGCRHDIHEVKHLIDTLHVPFVTTPGAKGLISELHPLSLRNGGMAASIWAQKYTQQPVDVCLALGTDLDDSSVGSTPYCSREGILIHVDTDARVFGRNLPTRLGIVADVGAFASCASDQASFETVDGSTSLDEAKRSNPFQHFTAGERCAHPAEVLLKLQSELPAARFSTDIGEHMLFALHYLTAAAPNEFNIQLNLGSMGSGIAGSVGLALADPSRQVVCIAGDGGMQMHGMEALVAIREKLPVLFVVFNDGRYNMVHHGMRQLFGEASAYDTPPIDFTAWGTSIGMRSHTVSKAGEIRKDLLNELFRPGGPALLDVRVDPDVHMSGGGRIAALQRMSMTNQGSYS
jgi:acetolactate synthase I/II/III large subunit